MIMRYLAAIFIILMAMTEVTAQERHYDIDAVDIVGARTIKDIGVQQTKLDSLVLKESIALSMADILAFNSSIFVKSYGRASLSTVSFRGTSPSHTQVTWNGMRINSPMLGMTDFSMIPSYFVDDASLLHGTSSVNETGGGLGGAVKLSTTAANNRGFGLQYVQGIGSFKTFDEFLRLSYGNDHWQTSTRVVVSTSANDFRYTNRDKKLNIYDEQMNIVDQYYPVERNKSGSYRDIHALQEVYYTTGHGDRIGLNAWYVNSNRELPMLTTDYANDTEYDNRQREQTLRAIVMWEHLRTDYKVGVSGGYIHTSMAYDYLRDPGNGTMTPMTRSRSKINTLYGRAEGEYYIGSKWLFTATLTAHQHFVESRDKSIVLQDGNKGIVGYNQARIELSGAVSAKWRPTERFGISAVLREELFGTKFTPIIPALFVDGVVSKRGNVVVKGSHSRNYRYPTLNDLYFLPGGNPNLRSESGWTYDLGASFAVGRTGLYSVSGSATWFDSYISDWILWLPTTKGFFSPRNIKDVHAYGVELKAESTLHFAREWSLTLDGTFAWTPSINSGKPLTDADRSVGKQLPYVPEYTATINGRLAWRGWAFQYKWCYYSERFTMSSNDYTLTGKLPEYFMSNISLEKSLTLRWADLSVKGTINNLFDEEYMSVLSRPMPGINFEIFIGITPKWNGK